MHPPYPTVRVLVVDDDQIVQMLLTERLTQLGARVVAADSGEEALLLWKIGGFSLVITDCWMSPMDGFELAVQIREREQRFESSVCPIWGHTADSSGDVVAQCIRSGMQGCLKKPASMEALHDLLGTTLSSAGPVVSNGNPTGRDILLPRWLDQAQSELMVARTQFEAGDIQALAAQLHRMKGAALMLGQDQVAQLCQEAEELTKQNQDLRKALNAIRRLLMRQRKDD